jgi:hypothetical protein
MKRTDWIVGRAKSPDSSQSIKSDDCCPVDTLSSRSHNFPRRERIYGPELPPARKFALQHFQSEAAYAKGEDVHVRRG